MHDVQVRRRRHAALGATCLRLVLVLPLVHAVGEGRRWQSILWLAVVVAADVWDGRLARAAGAESRSRRIADPVVDRLTIHAALAVAVLVQPTAAAPWAVLVVRDLAQAGISGWLLERRRTLLIGDSVHKAYSLSCAVFFLCLVLAPVGVSTAAGWAVCAVALALLADYARNAWGLSSGARLASAGVPGTAVTCRGPAGLALPAPSPAH